MKNAASTIALPTKIERLKARAETEWKALGKEMLAEQQAGVKIKMCRQELGAILIKLRKEVERQHAPLASTGGRPKAVWWDWFEEWQPPGKNGMITRDEAWRAMQIAGADDPSAASRKFDARKREAMARSRQKTFLGNASSVSHESPAPVSLVVRQVEGMIRKMSENDREALFNRIKDLLP